MQLCSSWQDLDWRSTSRSLSVVTELLVTVLVFLMSRIEKCNCCKCHVLVTCAGRLCYCCVWLGSSLFHDFLHDCRGVYLLLTWWWHSIFYIAVVLQQNRLRWYGHVLWKEDDDCVKKCMEYKVEGPRPRGRPKRTWREVVKEDRQARKLNTEDAMDRSRWRKLIKDVRWSGWVWVGECFFWYRPTRVVLDQLPLNGCVCVCVLFVTVVQ